MTGAGRGSRI